MQSSIGNRLAPKSLARIVGLLYLCMAGLGLFAMSLSSGIVQSGDGVSTLASLRKETGMLQLGLVADVASSLAFLLTAMALFVLLRRVHQTAAAAMVAFVVVAVAIGFANLANQYAELALATNAKEGALGDKAASALVALFTSMQGFEAAVDEIFWGLWLLPLAYLVVRSNQFPSLIGALLALAGVSWIVQSLTYFAGVNVRELQTVLTLGTIGEFVFMGYLVVKGVRSPRTTSLAATVRQHHLPTGV